MSTIVTALPAQRWGRYRAPAVALACGGLTAALTVAAGWPYWRDEGPVAVANAFVAGAFVTSGILLADLAVLRRTGRLAVAAGLCWGTTWVLCWDVGVLPALGFYANALFFVVFGWGLLLYPDGRLTGRADCWAAVSTTVGYGLVPVLTIIVSEPEWNGFAPASHWPTIVRSAAVFGFLSDAYTIANPLIATVFLGLLARRARRLYGLERSVVAPALVALGVAVVCLALLSPPLETDQAGHVVRGFAVQGVALTAIPLVLLVVVARRALAAATAADRMLRMAGPATVAGVQAALRHVLRDDTVEIYFWLPDESRYVDVAGEPARPAADGRAGRWTYELSTPSGERLALLTGGPALRRHRSYAEAALRAGRLALQNTRLQVVIQAQLVQTRAAQRRVADAEAAERHRIARDLHDGVQQRLLALAMAASAAEWSAEDSVVTAAAFRDIRAGVLAANEEVRNVARGLDPAVLRHAGLGGAVRDAVSRLALPVDLRVELTAADGHGELAERTVYFAVSEALANIAKHADATAVRVRLTDDAGLLAAEVSDDGRGGAAAGTGGGLAGLCDRVAAAGGSLALTSPPGAGTTVRVTVPVQDERTVPAEAER